jgi:hypothetical protein
VTNTGGEVELVSPDEEFTCDEYEDRVRKYLFETLAIEYPELRVFDAVEQGHLALQEASTEDLEQVHDTNGPFSISNPATFATRIINEIVFSTYGPNRPEMGNQGQWTKSRIKDACGKTDSEDKPLYPKHETTCVPIYYPNQGNEHGRVTLYFIRQADDGVIVSEETQKLM